jgi:rod shape-determining protein MreD
VRPVELGAALGAATLVHILAAHWVPGSLELLDLLLVVLVVNALSGSSLGGMLGGLAAGLLQDALSASVFGLHGFAGTMIGYATARVAQRLVVQRALGVGLVVAAAVILHQALLLVVSLLALPEPLAVSPLSVLIRSAVSGAVGALLYAAGRHWQSGAETRRRRRGRLRLD